MARLLFIIMTPYKMVKLPYLESPRLDAWEELSTGMETGGGLQALCLQPLFGSVASAVPCVHAQAK